MLKQIERFYAAFDRRDGEAMAAMYAPDGHFRDPVFGDLTGAEAGAMWRMLTRTARDLKVELAEHDDASAHWIATYTFSATGRPVVNDVRATFRFADGLIVDHVDEFSFWKWSRQALGTKGLAARLDAVPARARSAARPRPGSTSSSPRNARERNRRPPRVRPAHPLGIEPPLGEHL